MKTKKEIKTIMTTEKDERIMINTRREQTVEGYRLEQTGQIQDKHAKRCIKTRDDTTRQK